MEKWKSNLIGFGVNDDSHLDNSCNFKTRTMNRPGAVRLCKMGLWLDVSELGRADTTAFGQERTLT